MAKGLVMLDQRSDLFRRRDLDWFDRCENLKFSAFLSPKMQDEGVRFGERNATNMVPIWSTAPLFYLYLDLCALSNMIIFKLETVPISLLNIKLFFYRPMEDRISDRKWRLATRHISQPKRNLAKSNATTKIRQFINHLAFNKVPRRR